MLFSASLISTPEGTGIGTRPIRHDGVDKVTGRAKYGADYSFPNMLHGKVLRSPHAHARIKSINIEKALKVPGVKAIITGKEMPELPNRMEALGEIPKVSAKYLDRQMSQCLRRSTSNPAGRFGRANCAGGPVRRDL